jgi:AraC-like DNA-binding protein
MPRAAPGSTSPSFPTDSAQRVGAFTGLPALLREFGVDPAAVLARAGLQSGDLDDPDGRIPYAAMGRLLSEGTAQTHCPHFALLAGRMWRLGDLGLVGELARHSATVGEALRTMTVYQHLNHSGGLAFLLTHGDTVELGYAIYHPDIAGAEHIYDAVLVAGFNQLRELCGPRWRPTEVMLAHKHPVDTAPYRQTFTVTPHFDAELSVLRFPAVWLEHAIEGCDPARRRAALERARAADQGVLVDRASRALRMLMLHGKHSGDDVASMLAMHRRTLNRRLKAEGTTFQQVLDNVRFTVARQLLSGSDVPLDDVAATLGYAGVNPFMRTFRRWTGTTPGRWRHEAAAGRPSERESS